MKVNKIKEIVGFKSAEGSYFEIWKADDGYHLKNKYTEVPNEFGLYDDNDIKKLFDDLCERVPECVPVDCASGHPNSCMRVVFSDKTEVILKEQLGVGMNLCAFTSNVASFSEFVGGILYPYSEVITIEHIRWVMKTKHENYLNIVEMFNSDDDYIEYTHRIMPVGSLEIYKTVCYGYERLIVKISEEGKIIQTNKNKYLELLQKNHVKIDIIKEQL